MNCIEKKIQSNTKLFCALKKIQESNGISYLVGGTVRDYYLGLTTNNTDYDIEVHNILYDDLKNILEKYFSLSFSGKQFGIISCPHDNIDWCLPRKDFSGEYPRVIIDPVMTIEEALSRRDLTINSIAWEWNENNFIIHDPFNGIEDCKKNIARATDIILFPQDEMRFFRLLKYIGLYGLTVEQTLKNTCTLMTLNNIKPAKKHILIQEIYKKSLHINLVEQFLKETQKSI